MCVQIVTEDDRFTPRLGKIRSRGDASAKRYLSRIRAAIEKMRPNASRRSPKRGLPGSRIGRGSGVGSVAALRAGAHDRLRGRRVVVKFRIVKLAAGGISGMRAHLRYVERDGVARDGTPGAAYDRGSDHADGEAFLSRAEHDRHQFRVILAPEDAEALAAGPEGLRAFTREVMTGMERDLGTRLDWIGIDHFDTGHPHSHLIIRGRDDRNRDLVIAKSYISHGFRARASGIAEDWLGPRSERDIAEMQAREVKAERLTSLDKDLLAAAEEGQVSVIERPGAFNRFRRQLLIGRLQRLEAFGLAVKESPASWRLSDHLEPTLRQLGERGDIIRTMQRALGPERVLSHFSVWDPSARDIAILGRVAASGPADEIKGNRFLIVDAVDGRQWYVAIGSPEEGAVPPIGAIVRASAERGEPRAADCTIAAVARAHGGRYSEALHHAQDPSASAEFRAAHIRRLETLRRAGIVERDKDGGWHIPENYLERAGKLEAERGSTRVQVLSWLPLEELTERRSLTWLDRELAAGERTDPEAIGFGATLHEALSRRRAWLLAQGFASEDAKGLILDRSALEKLAAGELHAAGARLATSLGKDYLPAAQGARLEGTYVRPIHLASGRYALLERSHDFTLAPWRDVLEKRRGQAVAGLVRGESVQWELSRKRGRGIS